MIGYSAGQNTASARTILLNATGVFGSAPATDAFYVTPIRTFTLQNQMGVLQYDL